MLPVLQARRRQLLVAAASSGHSSSHSSAAVVAAAAAVLLQEGLLAQQLQHGRLQQHPRGALLVDAALLAASAACARLQLPFLHGAPRACFSSTSAAGSQEHSEEQQPLLPNDDPFPQQQQQQPRPAGRGRLGALARTLTQQQQALEVAARSQQVQQRLQQLRQQQQQWQGGSGSGEAAGTTTGGQPDQQTQAAAPPSAAAAAGSSSAAPDAAGAAADPQAATLAALASQLGREEHLLAALSGTGAPAIRRQPRAEQHQHQLQDQQAAALAGGRLQPDVQQQQQPQQQQQQGLQERQRDRHAAGRTQQQQQAHVLAAAGSQQAGSSRLPTLLQLLAGPATHGAAGWQLSQLDDHHDQGSRQEAHSELSSGAVGSQPAAAVEHHQQLQFSNWADYRPDQLVWGGCWDFLGVWPTTDDCGWVAQAQLDAWWEAAAAADADELQAAAAAAEHEFGDDAAADGGETDSDCGSAAAPAEAAADPLPPAASPPPAPVSEGASGAATHDKWVWCDMWPQLLLDDEQQEGAAAAQQLTLEPSWLPRTWSKVDSSSDDADAAAAAAPMSEAGSLDDDDGSAAAAAELQPWPAGGDALAGNISPAAAAAADAAAAAAIAAQLPQLRWPAQPLSLLTAVQHGALEMQKHTQQQQHQQQQQPFAWMYSSSSSSGAGVQFVLDRLAAASGNPLGWSGLQEQPAPAPPAPPQVQPHPHDLPVQPQQQQPQQQLQQQPQGAAAAAARQQPAASLTWSALWQAWKQSIGLAAAPGSSGGAPADAAHQHMSSPAGGNGNASTLDPSTAAPLPPPASGALAGAGFQLQAAQHSVLSQQEAGLLSRIAVMAAGTNLEPLLWSAVLEQPTTLTAGRASLLAPSAAGKRLPLSRAHDPAPSSDAAAAAAAVAVAGSRPGSTTSTTSSSSSFAAADWFVPVVFAAFQAARQVGQLLVMPLTRQPDGASPAAAADSPPPAAAMEQQLLSAGPAAPSPPMHPQADAAADAADSSDAVLDADGAASAGFGRAKDLTTLGLVATAPMQPGWWALNRQSSNSRFAMGLVDCAPGLQGPPEWQAQVQARQQQLWVQHLQEQQQQQQQAAARVRSGAGGAHEVVQAAVGAARTVRALQRLHSSYAHMFDCHPQLAASFLQRMRELLRIGDASGAGTAARDDVLARRLSSMSTQAAAAAASASDGAALLGKPAAGEAAAAGELFGDLALWYTANRQPPYDLLGVLLRQTGSQAADGPQAAAAGDAAGDAAAEPGRMQQVAALLALGARHRGRELPQSASLLPLLQHLQQHPPANDAQRLSLCRQLLVGPAALPSWPAQEQLAAYRLMHIMVPHMQPPAMLDVMALLLRQQLQQQPRPQAPAAPSSTNSSSSDSTHAGLLYRSVMRELASHASTVLAQPAGPARQRAAVAAFGGTSVQLAQLAGDACLGAAFLVFKAARLGHELPGTRELLEPSRPPFGAALEIFGVKQHRSFLARIKAWPSTGSSSSSSAGSAGTPAVWAEVQAAAARGELQLVAGVLAPLLEGEAGQQQQQPQQQPQQLADQLSELLPLLALSKQLVESQSGGSEDGAWPARTLASIVRGDAEGLLSGSTALDGISEAAAHTLLAPEVVQRMPPTQAVPCVWALQRLKLTSQASQLSEALCTAPPAPASSSSASSSSSSSNASSSSAPLVDRLSLYDLGQLLCVWGVRAPAFIGAGSSMRSSSTLLPVPQSAWDAVAAAASARVLRLSARLAQPARSDRGSSSRSAASEALRLQGLAPNLAALSLVGRQLCLGEQFHPAFQAALCSLLEATAAVHTSPKASKAQQQQRLLTPYSLSHIASTLAHFGGCTPPAAAALRSWTASLAPQCTVERLARLMWCCSVMDEHDAALWTTLRRELQQRLRASPAAAAAQQARWPRRQQEAAAAAAGAQDGGDDDELGDADEAEAPGRLTMGTLSALHQAAAYVAGCVPRAAPLLPPDVAAQAQSAYLEATRVATVSKLQRDVKHALAELAAEPGSPIISHNLEHKTVLGSMDMLAETQDTRVAIEVDGPFHFAANSPRHRLGATILRDHLLESKGFRVLSIHYADWPSSAKQHTRWLRAALASHHASLRSTAPSEPASE